MDSFELNKIIAAILMVALLVIGLGKIADGVFHVDKPENPGYKVEVEGQLASTTSQAAEVEQKGAWLQRDLVISLSLIHI